MVLEHLLEMQLKSYYRLIQIRESSPELIEKMAPRARKIVQQTTYYYDSETDTDSDLEETDFIAFSEKDSDTDSDYEIRSEVESETELSDNEYVSDSEEGSNYETETDPGSDSEELNEPKPYYGNGFRVYFDSSEDKKVFMQAFGFSDA